MIELKEFTKKFGSVTAVDAVSFQVEPGSIFGLVGSNGAGKSTLLRSICGVYAPDGGQVLLDGEAPYENPEAKGKVFFVSDYPYFMNQLTAMNTELLQKIEENKKIEDNNLYS